MKKSNIWEPVYKISPKIARALMDIEAAKTIVERTALPPAVEAELRRAARVRSTHFSTRIEGNRLTLKEAQEVIEDKKTSFHGRERDTGEVRNYWSALLKVEEWAVKKAEFSEDLIKRLHAIVEKGKRSKPTPYRTGQNAIKDSTSGVIVYMPPEARDVPKLMSEMAAWVRQAERSGMPGPIIAALAHYQFVTIHPYYDGNGRTARLLATFLLQRDGYGLRGFSPWKSTTPRTLRRITLPWPCISTIITTRAAPRLTLPAGLSTLQPFWPMSLPERRMRPQNTPRRASRLSLSRSGGWTAGQGLFWACSPERTLLSRRKWRQLLAFRGGW